MLQYLVSIRNTQQSLIRELISHSAVIELHVSLTGSWQLQSTVNHPNAHWPQVHT